MDFPNYQTLVQRVFLGNSTTKLAKAIGKARFTLQKYKKHPNLLTRLTLQDWLNMGGTINHTLEPITLITAQDLPNNNSLPPNQLTLDFSTSLVNGEKTSTS